MVYIKSEVFRQSSSPPPPPSDRVRLGHFVYHATHLALASGLKDLQVSIQSWSM